MYILIILLAFYGCSQAQSYKETTIDLGFVIHCPEETETIKLRCLLPQDIALKQEILEIEYSHEVSRFFQEQNNRYAEFWLQDPPELDTILIRASLRIYRQDLASRKQFPLPTSSPSLDKYLKNEKFIEIEEKEIRSLARKLRAKDPIKTLKNTFDYLDTHIEYAGYVAEDVGALKTLQYGEGDCTEFADLYIALNRVNKIPTRFMEGYVLEYKNIAAHDWLEVYLKDYGWVSLDATPGMESSFESLEKTYVVLSNIRNDEQLYGYHYWAYEYWGDELEINSFFEEKSDSLK